MSRGVDDQVVVLVQDTPDNKACNALGARRVYH